MGSIIYNPKKENKKQDDAVMKKNEKKQEPIDRLIENLSSVRPMGDTECEYAIYLEDYAYTYLYQFAHTDLEIEHAGAIIGAYYPETQEAIISGVMPISRSKLRDEDEWINAEALEEIYEEKENYFPGANIIGWVHMQPGYGTMLTTKQSKIHRELFDQEGTFLLLIDPISKIETFYAYQEAELKEQSGYYIYYDKNPSMQQFMLDKPFTYSEKEQVEDKAVNQFREINRRRTKEYQDRKRTNFTVITASIALLAMAAIVLRIQEQNDIINQMAGKLDSYENQMNVTGQDPDPNLFPPTFNEQEADEGMEPLFVIEEVKASTSEEGQAVVEEAVVVEEVVEEIAVEEVVEEEIVEEVAVEETVEEVAEETVVETSAPVDEAVVEQAVEEDVTEEVENTVQRTHVVQPGETLRSISMLYYNTETRTREIFSMNEMDDGDFIYVGQELILP